MKPNIEYLKPEELKEGHLYRIRARNSRLGIWSKVLGGFVISRYKFGDNFLFVEYHYDLGGCFGTVLPLRHLEKAPFNPSIFTRIYSFPEMCVNMVLKYLNDASDRYNEPHGRI